MKPSAIRSNTLYHQPAQGWFRYISQINDDIVFWYTIFPDGRTTCYEDGLASTCLVRSFSRVVDRVATKEELDQYQSSIDQIKETIAASSDWSEVSRQINQIIQQNKQTT